MFEQRVFSPDDLSLMDAQKVQRHDIEFMRNLDWSAYYKVGGMAVTLWEDDAPVASLGFIPGSPARCYLWAIVTRRINSRNIIGLVRFMRRYMAAMPSMGYHYLTTNVVSGFEPGHRLMDLLGFRKTHFSKSHDSIGRDHFFYERRV